jgi:hypothetical protein
MRHSTNHLQPVKKPCGKCYTEHPPADSILEPILKVDLPVTDPSDINMDEVRTRIVPYPAGFQIHCYAMHQGEGKSGQANVYSFAAHVEALFANASTKVAQKCVCPWRAIARNDVEGT